jgi:hypothetical protein
MPQLIVVAIILVAGWYAWKLLKREMTRVGAEVEAARKPSETLERDPDTGRYRPKKDG